MPPSVTLVFLVFNRRDELRESLRRMLADSDYPSDRVDAIVVDNASSDGSAEMVQEEFPNVQVITRDRNAGVSGFNDGFRAARGDWVLALDDDCYLPPDGLRRAVSAAQEHEADLVSFKVVSTEDPAWVFTETYPTGLFSFWGCAVLMRREVVEALGGYDPEIFVWANELEFMLRFFDRGFRHLHLPEVEAQHMKAPPPAVPYSEADWRPHMYNCRHFAYIAAKLLQPRDAIEASLALLTGAVHISLRVWIGAIGGVRETVIGLVEGLRHRSPVSPEVSRTYRRNFVTFASPWWLWQSPRQFARSVVRQLSTGASSGEESARRLSFFEARERFYPRRAAVLDFRR